MERAAVPRFGVAAFGVHLNGVVRRDGALLMWIGRRSPHKHTAPLKLDQIVAGGIAAGHSPRETLLKEAAEEAAMPAALAERARPAGIVRYRSEREEGLRNDILYVYDVELPADFVPRNTDGEIIEFFLLPIDEVVARVRDGDEFKFNCALVVIDFLVRQGLIGPEDGDYVDIVAGLHRP
jgi:8-oxo-dGTP pyrophosphatase MutT (NUDIX family)